MTTSTMHHDAFLKITRCLLGLIALVFGLANVAWAQGVVPNPSGPTVSSGRSYYFEIGLVLVMFGAALYAVCRSSFRR